VFLEQDKEEEEEEKEEEACLVRVYDGHGSKNSDKHQSLLQCINKVREPVPEKATMVEVKNNEKIILN